MKVKIEFELELPADAPDQLSKFAESLVREAMEKNIAVMRGTEIAPGVEAIVTVIP